MSLDPPRYGTARYGTAHYTSASTTGGVKKRMAKIALTPLLAPLRSPSEKQFLII